MNLLIVMAHPDDESMGNGGMLYRHARSGVAVHLICATRGGAGWNGRPAGRRPEELTEIRTGELERAAAVLGLKSVDIWDYPDGDVAASPQQEITQRIGAAINRLQPQVVVGWGPDGGYGHPDHISIGACTDRALAQIPPGARPAHYQMAIDRATETGYRRAFDAVGADGRGLPLVGFDEVSATFVLTEHELAVKAAAIACHLSQIESWREHMEDLPELRRGVLGRDSYRRVGGPFPNADLVTGLLPELLAVESPA